MQGREDLTLETATQILQRYWLFCKNRKKLSQQYQQRKNIIAEVIKTEETYVADLDTIVEVFQKPIQKKEMIPAKQLNSIFGNSMCHLSVYYTLHTHTHTHC